MENFIMELIQAESDGLDECLYAIDGKYLHVQRSDGCIDYTFYDMESLSEIDGGQLDIETEMLVAAAVEICRFHGIKDISDLCVADIEILNRIQEIQDAMVLNMRMRYNVGKYEKDSCV